MSVSQGLWTAIDAEKGTEQILLWSLQKEWVLVASWFQPCRAHFGLLICKLLDSKFVLFINCRFLVICYSSSRNWYNYFPEYALDLPRWHCLILTCFATSRGWEFPEGRSSLTFKKFFVEPSLAFYCKHQAEMGWYLQYSLETSLSRLYGTLSTLSPFQIVTDTLSAITQASAFSCFLPFIMNRSIYNSHISFIYSNIYQHFVPTIIYMASCRQYLTQPSKLYIDRSFFISKHWHFIDINSSAAVI